MLIDTRTEFCNAEALNTGAAGTYNIGDVVDIRNLRDVANGYALWLVISVQTTATSGGSATAKFRLVSDDNDTPSTTTATVHLETSTFAVADMGAGTEITRIRLPLEDPEYERYIGIQQVTGTAAFTAGAIDAYLTTDVPANKHYPEGQN